MVKRVAMLVCLLVLLGMALPAFANGPTEGRAGRAELRFLEGMIDHHQMAVGMSTDCLQKATSADLKTLCQAIITAQTAEITRMQDWVKTWYNVDYKPMAMSDMMKGMMSGGMGGMMGADPANMMGMMAGLNRYQGKDYDAAWLEAMIDHHDDAIHMSERILKYTTIHDDLKTLANGIIKDQTAEIEKMEAMLKTMSDSK